MAYYNAARKNFKYVKITHKHALAAYKVNNRKRLHNKDGVERY